MKNIINVCQVRYMTRQVTGIQRMDRVTPCRSLALIQEKAKEVHESPYGKFVTINYFVLTKNALIVYAPEFGLKRGAMTMCIYTYPYSEIKRIFEEFESGSAFIDEDLFGPGTLTISTTTDVFTITTGNDQDKVKDMQVFTPALCAKL